MRRMRVLQLVASSRGGGATHMLALASGLAARGHKVAATMPADGGAVEPSDFEMAGVRFHTLVGNSGSLLGPYRTLSELLANVAPDVVHGHGSRAAFWARLALQGVRSRRPALVCSMHGFAAPFYPLTRRIVQNVAMRWVTASAAAVVACCEAERSALLAARVVPPARTQVIPHGIDLAPLLALGQDDCLAARAALGADASDWIATMVCRIDRPRDFESLIAAFGRVAGAMPTARLWIVGDGPQRRDVEAMIHAAGLESQVRLWGVRRDVASFYAATDACVLTSWGWEGLPLSVIEAQAAARPVVVTDAGGSRESIEPGESGILVPRRDPAALSEALLSLAGDPGRGAAMGERGRDRARGRFGVETMVTRMEALYATLQPS